MSVPEALQRLQDRLDLALAERDQAPAIKTSRQLDPRLHGYQERAVQHLHDNPRAGLFLDMGLGKTAVVLQTLTQDHLPALVIAPKRPAENVWGSERDIWRPDLSIAIAAGNLGKRMQALGSTSDVVVIGRDNIKDVPVGKFRTVVIDELSGFKNRGSQRWKYARKICSAAAYVWGLTGTPSPNGMMDLWAQAFLLDGGQRLGKTLTSYRSRYFTPGRQLPTGTIIEWNLRKGAEAKIQNALSDICISMSAKDHLDLPEVTYNQVGVPMSAKNRKIYDTMVDTLVADLRGDSDDGEVHTAANAAVLTGKLSQIVAGFIYPDEPHLPTTGLHNEKVRAVQEIIDGTGSPVLVFYRFREELSRLLEIEGAETIDAPDAIDRWNRGEIPVLLAHPASAGHGLNLQRGGHTIVWASLTWSLEEYDQGNARLNRQGQQHPVVIHHLITPDTVDEAILDRLHHKTSVQDTLLRALASSV